MTTKTLIRKQRLISTYEEFEKILHNGQDNYRVEVVLHDGTVIGEDGIALNPNEPMAYIMMKTVFKDPDAHVYAIVEEDVIPHHTMSTGD